MGGGRRLFWSKLTGLAVSTVTVGLLLPYVVGEPVADAPTGVATGAPDLPAEVDEPEPAAGPAAAEPGSTDAQGPATSAGAAPDRGVGEVVGGSTAPAGVTLSASDRGVTETTIKLGLLVLQVGQVEAIGFAVGASVEEQRAAWKAFVDEVNRNGGILGRKVEPVYAQYDALDADTRLAACEALAVDGQVFAVLDGAGTFFGPAQLCVTDQHQTPLIQVGATGTPDEYIDRSGGRLFSLYMRGSRMMRTWAAELDRQRLLEGRTIGLVGDERSQATLDLLVDELTRHGYEITHRTNFSEDTGTAVSQVPVEVQQMRSKGVDTVLLAGNVVAETQFVQAADSQGWRPRWLASDWSNNSQDAAHQNQPAAFDGALAITVRRSGEHLVGRPEPPVERRCRELYERSTGQRLERGAINTSLYTLMCSTFDIFVAGATNAGPDLTRRSLTSGIEAIGGPFAINNMGDGSFGPGKHDAGLQIRTNRWTADCKCWKPADEYRTAPF